MDEYHQTTHSNESELYHWIGLALIEGVGITRFFRLIHAFKTAEQVFRCDYTELCQIVPPRVAAAIKKGPDGLLIEKQLNWANHTPHRFLLTASPQQTMHYPSLLAEIADPPVLLYAVGQRALLDFPSIGIVGSRQCTAQGRQIAHDFASQLSHQGITIVSGLALGIDTAAHQGGLNGVGKTVAVLPTSLDKIYPAQNKMLAKQIADTGLLVSEIPIGLDFPIERNFSRRNRIISGLSLGVLIVEAKIRSGSLSTAQHALDQNREVFAIPGSIYSELSTGCHALIQSGAKLVTQISDITNELHFAKRIFLNPFSFAENDVTVQQQNIQKNKRTIDSQGKIQDINNAISFPAAMLRQEKRTPIQNETVCTDPVLSLLQRFKQLDLDRLCEETGMSISALSSHLLHLELDGKIISEAGFYKIL